MNEARSLEERLAAAAAGLEARGKRRDQEPLVNGSLVPSELVSTSAHML